MDSALFVLGKKKKTGRPRHWVCDTDIPDGSWELIGLGLCSKIKLRAHSLGLPQGTAAPQGGAQRCWALGLLQSLRWSCAAPWRGREARATAPEGV